MPTTDIIDNTNILMASVSLLGRLAANLDELEIDRAEDLWRWRAVGETMIRDIFGTAEEWEHEAGEDDGGE